MTGNQLPFGERRRKNGFAAESVGYTIAEGASMVTSLGVVAVADTLAPKMVDRATKLVAKTLILPHLDFIERNMKKICHIKDCQTDEKSSRQQRAEGFARAVVLFTPAWLISLGVKAVVREKMKGVWDLKEPKPPKTHNWFKDNIVNYMSPYAWKIFAVDEGIHYGSLIYFNTAGAEYTGELIQANTKMLQKSTGMSERKAHDIASMTIVWEMPNLLGLGAALGMIYGKHRYGWGDQRKPHR